MPDITVEVTQSDITANVTSPNITANVTSADVAANVTTTDVTANVEAANVTVNITGGGSPHIIQDEGVAETQRANLNFVGAGVSVSDDSANNATVVTISGGGGGGTWGSITGTLSDQTDLQTALDGKVDENAAITGATKTKITYDAKGLVTAGADAAIADITGLQTALDAKAASSHTHALSDITQSGATTNQVPKWNGSAWVPANDAGGGASVTEITYADMQTAITNGTLTPGAWYLITDAAGTDLGFLTNAVNENTINVSGVGGYLNADFQAVGDYSGTPEPFNDQSGIWRQGFEQITINYLNLTGGTFAAGDTITGGTTGATAVIVSDDGATSMTAYMTSAGVAFDGLEVLDNGAGVTADQDGAATGPTIVLGDCVIWNLLHYQLTDAALLDGNNPATNTAAYTLLDKATYPETYVTAWDLSEFDFTNNWIQERRDLVGNKYAYSYETDNLNFGLGESAVNFFQWGNRRLIGNKISNSAIDQKNTDLSATANTFETYAYFDTNTSTALFSVEFCVFGLDSGFSGNIFSASSVFSRSTLAAQSGFFQNKLGSGTRIEGVNLGNAALFRRCVFGNGNTVSFMTLYPSAKLQDITTGTDTAIENNIIENGGSLTGITAGDSCSISANTIGKEVVFGGNSTMAAGALATGNLVNGPVTDFSLSDAAQFVGNEIAAGCDLSEFSIANLGVFNNNLMLSSSVFSGVAIGESSAIRFNVFNPFVYMSNCVTGDFCVIEKNALLNNVTISNKTFDANVLFSGNTIGVSMDVSETISDNIEGKRAVPGFSDILGTIDITGLTTLDCTAAWAQYRGIYNITSSNANEAIDTITNPPTAFPFTIRPAAGLTLTVTGTAYSGIAAGQIALKATDYTLDGDKGEYIVLEIDPLGTGALIEKQVVNGLL